MTERPVLASPSCLIPCARPTLPSPASFPELPRLPRPSPPISGTENEGSHRPTTSSDGTGEGSLGRSTSREATAKMAARRPTSTPPISRQLVVVVPVRALSRRRQTWCRSCGRCCTDRSCSRTHARSWSSCMDDVQGGNRHPVWAGGRAITLGRVRLSGTGSHASAAAGRALAGELARAGPAPELPCAGCVRARAVVVCRAAHRALTAAAESVIERLGATHGIGCRQRRGAGDRRALEVCKGVARGDARGAYVDIDPVARRDAQRTDVRTDCHGVAVAGGALGSVLPPQAAVADLGAADHRERGRCADLAVVALEIVDTRLTSCLLYTSRCV